MRAIRSGVVFAAMTMMMIACYGQLPSSAAQPRIAAAGQKPPRTTPLPPVSPKKSGPEIGVGTAGPPNFDICAAAFLRTAFHSDTDSRTYRSDEEAYREWFCSTSDNRTAFSFASALKAYIPQLPVPIDGSASGSYDRSQRSNACQDLQRYSFHQYLSAVNQRITDNGPAIAGFNQCVATLAGISDGNGRLTAAVAIADAQSGTSPVTILVRWLPPAAPGAPVPWMRGIVTQGDVQCDESTLPRDTHLMPAQTSRVLCERTGCQVGKITVFTHTAGTADVDLPKCIAESPPETCGTGRNVDLQNDPTHCGSCGNSCGSGGMCANSYCTLCQAAGSSAETKTGDSGRVGCRMRPGAPLELKLEGSHGMSDNYVFPGCNAGGCDVNAFNVDVRLKGPGVDAVGNSLGRHWQNAGIALSQTTTVPADGLVDAYLHLDKCHWAQSDQCRLSWLTVSAITH